MFTGKALKTLSSNSSGRRGWQTFPAFCAGLFAIFLALFFPVLAPSNILFSNDGPLGAAHAACFRAPSSFLGIWYDLTSIGVAGGSYPLSLTGFLFWVLGPLYYSKVYAPLTLIFLGISAWFLFKKLGLAPLACALGGVAAALNSSFFSASCWGVGTHAVTIGASYLALGLLADPSSRLRPLKLALAGLMVGMGVTEGADIGALFSMAVAAFIIYGALIADGPTGIRLARGVGRVAVIACFAGFFAAQAVTTLIGTQIQGIAGTQQDAQTKQQHWDYATQWSLPKREALGFAIPGLFGYRMDRADGGAYWGAVGRDPNWDRYFASGKQGPPPGGTMRFSGGGIYAGILVLLIAAWAAAQSLRKKDSVFSLQTRRWIWFWLAIFSVSLLLAFGRFAPFYQFLYALPYFSTIRNPAKFCYFCNWALVILFAYGVNGLYRLYIETQNEKAAPRSGSKTWWQRIRGFDRTWTLACGAVLGVAAVGWLIFASSSDAFERYLQEVDFEPAMAHLIAQFSVGQVAIFLVFFAASILLVTLVISGSFRGPRAKWGGLLLCTLLVIDLGRANEPWIVTWNYHEKYASNPIIDRLRQQPYEHRVAGLWWPFLLQVFNVPKPLSDAERFFHQLYGIEWTQHHFLYYDVQDLDKIQMPREPEDLRAFEAKLFPANSTDLSRVGREWQLTNTRYLLGTASFLQLLNQYFDPALHRFRIAERFDIEPKPGIIRPTKLEEYTAVPNTNGPFALFEFTAALPRASLYSNWQLTQDDKAALEELASPAFDPEKTVLLPANSGVAPALNNTNQPSGGVKFTSYAPKDIVLSATATSPSILLLNDRFDPNWKVWVDGKAQPLLRCNYIMRGVSLSPGTHKVEFRFQPPIHAFYVSVAAVTLTALFWGLLALIPTSTNQEPQSEERKAPAKQTVAAH